MPESQPFPDRQLESPEQVEPEPDAVPEQTPADPPPPDDDIVVDGGEDSASAGRSS